LRLFFYGTLLAGNRNAAAARIHRKLRPLAAGIVRGRLIAIPDPAGWYPGLVPGGRRMVRGVLYEARARLSMGDLAALDRFEHGGGPHREYVRAGVAVRIRGASVRAQAYLYRARPPAGAVEIGHGNFAAFLSERGLEAYDPDRRLAIAALSD
jgi:gamma-glutamylcyclotransferase (GGCT)/AIG2-like uncharacterized protein YtfP